MSKTKTSKPKSSLKAPAKSAQEYVARGKSRPLAIAKKAPKSPEPDAKAPPQGVAKQTKLSLVIALLSRPEGATLTDLTAATGWQPHTVRAALSHALAKKRGYQIVSDKPQGEQRIYKIAQAPKDDH